MKINLHIPNDELPLAWTLNDRGDKLVQRHYHYSGSVSTIKRGNETWAQRWPYRHHWAGSFFGDVVFDGAKTYFMEKIQNKITQCEKEIIKQNKQLTELKEQLESLRLQTENETE